MEKMIKDAENNMVCVELVAKAMEDVLKSYRQKAEWHINAYADSDLTEDLCKERDAVIADYEVVKEAMDMFIGMVGVNRVEMEKPVVETPVQKVAEPKVKYINDVTSVMDDVPFPVAIPQKDALVTGVKRISKEMYKNLANLNNKLNYMEEHRHEPEKHGNFEWLRKECNRLHTVLTQNGVKLTYTKVEGRLVAVTGCAC